MSEIPATLMEENLKHVWSERNAERRLKAIERIYTTNAVLYHVGEQTTGIEAINQNVSNVLKSMPEAFVFTQLKPVVINNNIGRLIWGVGPEGLPPVARGMDIAVFDNGKIGSLYVFLES